MKFENFPAAYLILGVLALLIFYALTRRQGLKTLETLAPKELLGELWSSQPTRRRKTRMVFLFLALILAIAALMRPQWGVHWEESKSRGLDILIAVDVSKSMLADDIKPNRLEQARAMVKDYVRLLKGDRIGLIAFAGQAFLLCPLTTDYNGFILASDSLSTETIPRGGTALSAAIEEALKYFRGREKGPRILLLLSDGEDHAGEVFPWAEKARQEGLEIFCIGMGTREGGLIPLIQENGQKEFLKDSQGRIVKSVLNEDLLEKIASRSGGGYVRTDDRGSAINKIHGEKLSKLEKGTLAGNKKKQYREWFQLPLTLAFLLLFFEPILGGRGKKG